MLHYADIPVCEWEHGKLKDKLDVQLLLGTERRRKLIPFASINQGLNGIFVGGRHIRDHIHEVFEKSVGIAQLRHRKIHDGDAA